MRRHGLFDVLFQFKLVRLKEVKKKGHELAEMAETELRELPKVAATFSEARNQLRRYGDALVRRFGRDTIRPRSYIVVAIGFERIFGEEVSSLTARTDNRRSTITFKDSIHGSKRSK